MVSMLLLRLLTSKIYLMLREPLEAVLRGLGNKMYMSELIKEGETYPNGSGSLTVLKYEKAIRILVKHNDEVWA